VNDENVENYNKFVTKVKLLKKYNIYYKMMSKGNKKFLDEFTIETKIEELD